MTPSEQIKELKQKYPLAFDTIKLPVRFAPEWNNIVDDNGIQIVSTKMFEVEFNEQRQDQIGELIAELLNGLQ